jgi:hypothetical protein
VDLSRVRIAVSPHLLPWWGWLLAAVVCWIVYEVCQGAPEDASPDVRPFLRFVSAIAGVLSLGIGVVQFVRWAWGS